MPAAEPLVLRVVEPLHPRLLGQARDRHEPSLDQDRRVVVERVGAGVDLEAHERVAGQNLALAAGEREPQVQRPVDPAERERHRVRPPVRRVGHAESPDACVGGDGRHRVYARCGPPRRRKYRYRSGEGEVGIPRSQHRAGRRRRVVAQQHRRRLGVRHRRFVLGVGEKREIASLSVLDAGNANDFNLSIALEAAGEALSKLP